MRISRFEPRTAGSEILARGSSGVTVSGLARANGEARLNCPRLEPDGIVGEHPASVPQLFVVVKGNGQVRAAGEEAPVEAGQAFLREAGGEHESQAGPEGMTVVVLEADHLSRPR